MNAAFNEGLAGYFHQANESSSSANYVSIPYSAGLAKVGTTRNFTLSLWFKWNGLRSHDGEKWIQIANMYNNDLYESDGTGLGKQGSWSAYIWNNNSSSYQVYVETYDTRSTCTGLCGRPRYQFSSISSVNDKAWHHLVVFQRGHASDPSKGIYGMYLDGVRGTFESNNYNGTIPTKTDSGALNMNCGNGSNVDLICEGPYIGWGPALGIYGVGHDTANFVPFNGSIDSVLGFTRALSHDEITTLYNENGQYVGIDKTNMTLAYGFENPSGSTVVYDCTGLHNGTWYVADSVASNDSINFNYIEGGACSCNANNSGKGICIELTIEPTGEPTSVPTGEPTGVPTGEPTGLPTGFPSLLPTRMPITDGTGTNSAAPTTTTGNNISDDNSNDDTEDYTFIYGALGLTAAVIIIYILRSACSSSDNGLRNNMRNVDGGVQMNPLSQQQEIERRGPRGGRFFGLSSGEDEENGSLQPMRIF